MTKSLGAGAVVAMLSLTSSAALAAPGRFTDPDDVSLRLDLETIAHSDGKGSVVYTLETYEPFSDEEADFTWFLDLNQDGAADRTVSVSGDEGELVGEVEEMDEKAVATGSVSRPGPNAIRVSFPTSVLKGATTYDYYVLAHTDRNGDGEVQAGEADRAPDAGWYRHRTG